MGSSCRSAPRSPARSKLYGAGSRLDFADAYLAAAALEVGPAAVASFDTDLDTVEGVHRISA